MSSNPSGLTIAEPINSRRCDMPRNDEPCDIHPQFKQIMEILESTSYPVYTYSLESARFDPVLMSRMIRQGIVKELSSGELALVQ